MSSQLIIENVGGNINFYQFKGYRKNMINYKYLLIENVIVKSLYTV